MTLVLVLTLGFALAYANGSNDVSKGIATLVGSGVTNYRRAILWGTFWTGVGGLAGAFVARAMIQTFGRGLLAPGIHASMPAALAGTAGAALWVILATHKALPVSTTHAIVGSVIGVSSLAYGFGGVNWLSLGDKIALPLLLSPIVSLVLTVGLLRAWRMLVPGLGNDCICAEMVQPLGASIGGAAMTYSTYVMPQLELTMCPTGEGRAPWITLNHLHWLTSGATSFARGLNDVPKMVAILMSAAVLSGKAPKFPLAYFAAITLGVVAGSWVAGQRVTEVLACEVTPMDHREGFAANLITATLVGFGAVLGWPMSTTQVASGAIIGIGSTKNERLNTKTVGGMLIAWVVTLPGAALLGAMVFFLLRTIGVH
jgi:PiT family inorganic phosphate transporter